LLAALATSACEIVGGRARVWDARALAARTTALVTDVPLASGIAVDATSVYVATSSGQILKVDRW